MPLCLSSLREQEREIAVPFDGDALKVWYRPGALTPELESILRQAGDEKAPEAPERTPMLEVLTRIVARWDLLDEPDGQVVPVTHEVLFRLPSALLLAILRAVYEDVSPNP